MKTYPKPEPNSFYEKICSHYVYPQTNESALEASKILLNWDEIIYAMEIGLISIEKLQLTQVSSIKNSKVISISPFSGFGLLLIIISIIVLIFSWKLFIPIVILGLIMKRYGDMKKNKSFQIWREDILTKIYSDNLIEGMAELCAYYNKQIICFQGPKLKAMYPFPILMSFR